MNLRELEYLIAIDEELHFHKAAEKCFVTQPTLSGQIKKLEQELGILLVERSNRQVQMTLAGKAVVAQARLIISQTKILKEIATSFEDPMKSDLHIGLIPTIAPYLLPLIIPEIKTKFPQLKLWLHEYQTHILLDKLRNTELDVLILALPIDAHEFEQLDLYKEAFYLAVSKSNGLSKYKEVTLKHLEQQEILLLEEGHCLRDHALDVCFLAGAKEQSNFHASSLETLRHMVAEGMGMTLFPELAISKHLYKNENIKYIPFVKPVPTRQIGLLYRKNSYRIDVYKKLAQVIKLINLTTKQVTSH